VAENDEFVIGKRGYGRNTQTAATVIVQLVEPWPKGGWTRLSSLIYRAGANDHLITVMRPCNMVRFAADAAAAQAAVVLTADPGVYNVKGTLATANNVIAASDYVAYKAADGTFKVDTVASGSGVSPTLTTNLPTGGVKAGDPLWFFGIVTDTNPNNNQAHPRFSGVASTTLTLTGGAGLGTIPDHKLLDLGNGQGQPLVIISDNVTAAGFLENVGVEYVYRSAIS
jgi:hypothetical protein